LTSQIRRSAVSIPSNIGEGSRRKRRKAHLNHLDIALGSQGEVDVQLEIARRLAYVTPADYKRIASRVDDVGRMLNGLIESLQPKEGGLGLSRRARFRSPMATTRRCVPLRLPTTVVGSGTTN